MKFLVVVHRYWPNSGGSENNCYRFAKQASKMGHDVTVLTENGQSHDNVKVTNNIDILITDKFDLIFVHGSCPMQDIVLNNIELIQQKSPVFYLLVQPSDSAVCQHGIEHAHFVGVGTSFDEKHCKKYGAQGKMRGLARPYYYPVDDNFLGKPGFKERYEIETEEMFLSVGGFWPHKKMHELVKAFEEAKRPNCTLVLMGYDTRFGSPPPQSEFVKVVVGADQQDVADALFEADLYISNSEAEGFGMVLMEALQNETPWISTPVAIAYDLDGIYGTTFKSYDELVQLIKTYEYNEIEQKKVEAGKQYVARYHSPERCVAGMMNVVAELNSNQA